jgi:P-aminobenzoate N-oxygenase AurF
MTVADRERTARRLLNSSARNSYDPHVDIDWDAPLVEGKYFLPVHRCTLYGTPMWQRLSEQQRVELTRHELASIASVGIWFEVILMELLVRHSYDADPRSRHVRYALTEVADECRHSVMFARMIEKVGCPAYGPGRTGQRLGRIFGAIASGPSMFAGILVAEEITDALQRESMNDESVQPLVRMANRIHVIEEARHVRFAREEVERLAPRLSRAGLAYHRAMLARTAYVVVRALVHPKVYKAVGLDEHEARQVALANPHYRDTLRWASGKLVSFLDDNDLIGGPSRKLWRAVALVD